MKAKYINPFLDASIRLFREFLEMEIKVGKPFVLEDKHHLNDVSALIGLAGETSGAVVLSLSHDTALKMGVPYGRKKTPFSGCRSS